jgi:hypothetical protein
MAETPIESFCINLLSSHNIDDNDDFYSEENAILNKEMENLKEVSKYGKSPPSSWIRTVFLTAILYAKMTAICLILIFILLCVIRLSLVPNDRTEWTEMTIQPIISILLCMFPLSFSLPFSLLLLESTTTAGFLATTEVILRSDENGNKCNYHSNDIDDSKFNNDRNNSGKSNKNSENEENKKSTNSKNDKKIGIDPITGKKKSISDFGTSCSDFSLVNNPLRNDQFLNGREAGKYGSQDRLNNELNLSIDINISNNNDNKNNNDRNDGQKEDNNNNKNNNSNINNNNNNNNDSNDRNVGKKGDYNNNNNSSNNHNNIKDVKGKGEGSKSVAETHKSGLGKYSLKSSSKDDGMHIPSLVRPYTTHVHSSYVRKTVY